MTDTIISVITGGIIAIIGILVGFLVQHKVNCLNEKRASRKQAYISAIKWFSRLNTSDMDFLKDTHKIHEEARIGVYLFGSKNAEFLFEQADKVNSDYEKIETFKKQVGKEISYK